MTKQQSEPTLTSTGTFNLPTSPLPAPTPPYTQTPSSQIPLPSHLPPIWYPFPPHPFSPLGPAMFGGIANTRRDSPPTCSPPIDSPVEAHEEPTSMMFRENKMATGIAATSEIPSEDERFMCSHSKEVPKTKEGHIKSEDRNIDTQYTNGSDLPACGSVSNKIVHKLSIDAILSTSPKRKNHKNEDDNEIRPIAKKVKESCEDDNLKVNAADAKGHLSSLQQMTSLLPIQNYSHEIKTLKSSPGNIWNIHTPHSVKYYSQTSLHSMYGSMYNTVLQQEAKLSSVQDLRRRAAKYQHLYSTSSDN